jgi:AcrR family transcriptional regulator
MLPSMARPVAADAEATRARILAAAVQLVAERGIAGTTVRDVAAVSRVSLATVLHYFGSKDGLYAACVQAMDDELGTLRAGLLEAAAAGTSPRDALARMVRRAWDFARVHRVAHQIVLRMVLDEGGMPRARLDSLLRPGLEDAEQILAPLLGVSPLRARLTMQTLVQLVARYAICSDDELCVITASGDAATAARLVGDHLVDLACGLLLSPTSFAVPALAAVPAGEAP